MWLVDGGVTRLGACCHSGRRDTIPDMSPTLKEMRDELSPTGHARVDSEFVVAKVSDEDRYTLGVMYVPDALDFDDEYTDARTLQKALWDQVRKGDRSVRDTHTKRRIGETVELMSWPFPVEVEAQVPNEGVRKYRLPAGTVFAGVVWNENAWDRVKKGEIQGYSMGGVATRVTGANGGGLEKMRELRKRKVEQLPKIENEDDLRSAMLAYGRAEGEEQKRIRDHIIERARELDLVDKLPAKWNVQKFAQPGELVVDSDGREGVVIGENVEKGQSVIAWLDDAVERDLSPEDAEGLLGAGSSG